MLKVNQSYLTLEGSYLFQEIGRRVQEMKEQNPGEEIIRLGIGDVTRPLSPAVVEAMRKALLEMSDAKTFQGYPPYYGYDVLREQIRLHDYQERGVLLDLDEIFVSDGAKSDTANILDITGTDNRAAVCDPVYPVYVDTNLMLGRKVAYLPCTEANGFLPEVPKEDYDILYLCFPNNPTGTMIDRAGLQKWVDYALEHKSLLLYDGAYTAFISGDYPHSIYELEGAKQVAIEFRSFSKTAGFTGVRCAYTVVPKELQFEGVSLHALWMRRQSTKFNGVSYITQMGAAAVYSPQGRREAADTLDYYKGNAQLLKEGLQQAGFTVFGGEHSPYVWFKTRDNMSSWDFFDLLLKEAHVVGTPGSGFGKNGEGFFRLTGFGDREKTKIGLQNIIKLFA